jgi:hypothetical protein
MDWNQVLTIVGTNIILALMSLGTTITLFLWARSEARNDQSEIRQEMKEFRETFREFREIWMAESKDFHERLLKIEMERNKK